MELTVVVFLKPYFWKEVQRGGVEYSSTKVLQKTYHKHETLASNEIIAHNSNCETKTKGVEQEHKAHMHPILQ